MLKKHEWIKHKKAVKNGKEFLKVREPLIIYNEDGSYTDEIYKIYDKRKDE